MLALVLLVNGMQTSVIWYVNHLFSFFRWVKTFWLFFLILESSHFSHLAMKCIGFFYVCSYLFPITSCHCHLTHFTAMWRRFSPIQHVQLSSPGNSRDQLGRMLTVDSRQVFMPVYYIYDSVGACRYTAFRIMD